MLNVIMLVYKHYVMVAFGAAFAAAFGAAAAAAFGTAFGAMAKGLRPSRAKLMLGERSATFTSEADA